jgi:spastin
MQSSSEDRILVMGATNRPFELDNAALRRFPKRIHIGLPDHETRICMVKKLLDKQSHALNSRDLNELARLTEGYSGSDLTALAKDASLGPIRERNLEELKVITANNIRPLTIIDFKNSLSKIRQSTARDQLLQLEKWNNEFGDINA